MRTLADYDFDKAKSVYRWPMREALLAYLHRLREAAARDYRNQLLQWASLRAMNKVEPPKPPAILRERLRG